MISNLYYVNFVVVILVVFLSLTRMHVFTVVFPAIIWSFINSFSMVNDTDVAVYKAVYEIMEAGTFYSWGYDFTFWGLMFSFAFLKIDFQIFYFFILLVQNLALFYVARTFLRHDYKYISFLIIYSLSTSFIFFQNNILRQGLAFSLILPVLLLNARMRFKWVPVFFIHYSAAIFLIAKNRFATIIFIIVVLLAGLQLNTNYSSIWIVKKALRLMDKDYSGIYVLLIGVIMVGMSYIRTITYSGHFKNLGLLVMALAVVPYIGYRFTFYAQPIIILLFLNGIKVREVELLAFMILNLLLGVLIYSHPSILKVTGYFS